jgi:glycosyltransferase involved in cell wall biosynthesis
MSYLKDNSVDVIITSGPPHSLHLIGMQLKSKLNVKWISDFRDPWTNIDYFHRLPLSKKSLKKHQQLEESVVKNSDHVIVVGNTMKQEFLRYNSQVVVISNGFDTSEREEQITVDDQFTITHVGMMNADRNPKNLWNTLKKLSDESDSFKKALKIRLIGKVAGEIKEQLSIFDESQVDFIDYLNHTEVYKHQRASQVLLLSINNVPNAMGIVTGKIFEYLQAKRPILAIGPEEGDAANILNITNAGKIFDFQEERKLEAYISQLFEQYSEGNLVLDSKNIERYHRKQLTGELAKIIKKTICQA